MDKVCVKCKSDNTKYLITNDFRDKNKKIKNYIYNQKVINTVKNESKSLNHSQAFISKLKSVNLQNNKFQNSQSNIYDIKAKKDFKMVQFNKRKIFCVSPDIKHKDSDKFLEKYNFETYPDKIDTYLIKLPVSFIPTRKANKNKNKDLNYFLNKTDTVNNKSERKNNKLNFIKKINASPKINQEEILPYNSIKNFNNHKKVLSVSEQKDLLNYSSQNSYKNIYNIQPNNINHKYHSMLKNNNNKLKQNEFKHYNHEIIETEVELNKNLNNNYNLRNMYDNNNINRLSKSNKRNPVYINNYS